MSLSCFACIGVVPGAGSVTVGAVWPRRAGFREPLIAHHVRASGSEVSENVVEAIALLDDGRRGAARSEMDDGACWELPPDFGHGQRAHSAISTPVKDAPAPATTHASCPQAANTW